MFLYRFLFIKINLQHSLFLLIGNKLKTLKLEKSTNLFRTDVGNLASWMQIFFFSECLQLRATFLVYYISKTGSQFQGSQLSQQTSVVLILFFSYSV